MPARANVGGLCVPAGEPAARSMWEDEGVAGRPPLWKVSQRGPGIEAAVGLQR